MQVLDSDVNDFVHTRAAQKKNLDHEAVLVLRLVSAADQPFHFRFVEAVYRPPASPQRLQLQTPACLLHDVFGLVISQMVLAPDPDRLRDGFSQAQ
jgi:hypothetical protein